MLLLIEEMKTWGKNPDLSQHISAKIYLCKYIDSHVITWLRAYYDKFMIL